MICHFHQNVHRLQIVIRRPSLGQLESCDSKGPNISFKIIPFRALFHYLGGHPAGRSDKRVFSALHASDFRADAKIAENNMSFQTKKYISSFDVSVDLTLVVEVVEAQNDLLENSCNNDFVFDSAFVVVMKYLVN